VLDQCGCQQSRDKTIPAARFWLTDYNERCELGESTLNESPMTLRAGQESTASYEDLTGRVIGAAIEVHRQIGPGLLEMVYEDCMCEELSLRGIRFERQVQAPVVYKGRELGSRYKVDLIVERLLIVELKSVEKLIPVHKSQVLSQLRMTRLPLGLLLNFNVPTLSEGIKRIVNGSNMAL
jgi:GxxExxY protein